MVTRSELTSRRTTKHSAFAIRRQTKEVSTVARTGLEQPLSTAESLGSLELLNHSRAPLMTLVGLEASLEHA
jgi:hypothetical protein